MLSSRRGRFSSLEKTLGKNLSFLSAGQWTGLSLLFGAGAAYFLATGGFLAAALLFAIAALCDAIDGAVARHLKTAGSRGAYIDTIADRYVEFFVIAGIFVAPLPDALLPARLWLLAYLFGSMMTTYAKAAAKEKGIVKAELNAGILQRAERMSLLFAGVLLAALEPLYLTYMIALLAALSNITAVQRIAKALR